MPQFNVTVANNRVLIVVHVATAGTDTFHDFMALVDTGATNTAITPAAVQQLGAVSCGRTTVSTASEGSLEADQYALDIRVPVETTRIKLDGQETTDLYSTGKLLLATGLPDEGEAWHVLLGMDILQEHHLTLVGGYFFMSV